MLLLALMLAAPVIFAQKKEGTLIIKIHPVFNGAPVNLSTDLYVNAHQDSLFIDVFKCYLTAIKLMAENGTEFAEKKSAHLINAEDSTSLVIRLKQVPEGVYKSLNFAIGVDSLSSVSGALDADLDPAKGMYWAWNTGYIDAKLTGRCKQCKTRKNGFEYHIGGYSGPYKTIQKVKMTTDGLSILSNKTTVIELNVDLAEWFKNPEIIDLSKTNAVLIPGKEALRMAQNYADMFQNLKITTP